MEKNNVLNNQSGFSLVEVIIAGGLAVALFVFLNQSLSNLNQTQRRIEKREDVNRIKNFVIKHLTDYKSWRDNPSSEIPSSDNDHDIYYYSSPRSELAVFAYGISKANEILPDGKSLNCPSDFDNCRVSFISYSGLLLSESEIQESGFDNTYTVFIDFLTEDQYLSRNFVPSFKVRLVDQTVNPSSRVLDQDFFVNPSSSLRRGGQTIPLVEGEYVDSIARMDCFKEVVDIYPQDRLLANDLCRSAYSKAPAECFITLKRDFGVESSVAMIACTAAMNEIPLRCYSESRALNTQNSYRAILCHRAESFEPINCAKKLIDSGLNRNNQAVYQICSQAQDSDPARCFLGLRDTVSAANDVALNLCPHHKR